MILITGGARSGKSSLAERLAGEACERVFYIATSIATDDEMTQRILEHRSSRPDHWRTWEGYRDLATVLTQQVATEEAVILECVTTLITNLLFDLAGDTPVEEMDFAALEVGIQQEITALLEACKQCQAPVYLVTNELGMGIVPENRLARHFRDIAGRVNQRLAAAASEVYLLVSGLEVKIK